MGDLFEAEAGVLARAAVMVGQAHQDLDATAQQLAGRVDGYLAGWRGEGATAFTVLHQTWQTQHRRIVGVLIDLERSLQTTQQQATARDDEAQAGFAQVGSVLQTGRL